MINSKIRKISTVVTVLLITAFSGYCQNSEPDSIQTPFRKGRWITGLGGSINSSSSALGAGGDRNFSTGFTLNSRNGSFVRDRWLVGFTVVANRTTTEELVKRESETLFVGPSTSYYFMKSSEGSVYASIGLGYTRYREDFEITQVSSTTSEKIDGGGIGALFNLGYSYVFSENVSFDLGFEVSSFWLTANRVSDPGAIKTKNNINLGGIAFSFGFNVLLDSFFF